MSVSFTENIDSRGNPNTKATKGIPTSTSITSFPENLIGDRGDGHFIQFFVNEQDNAKVDFQGGGSGNRTSMPAGAGATQVSVKRAPVKRLLESNCIVYAAQVSLNQKSNYGEIEIGSAVAAGLAGAKGGATVKRVSLILSVVCYLVLVVLCQKLQPQRYGKRLILVLLVRKQRLNYNLVQY